MQAGAERVLAGGAEIGEHADIAGFDLVERVQQPAGEQQGEQGGGDGDAARPEGQRAAGLGFDELRHGFGVLNGCAQRN